MATIKTLIGNVRGPQGPQGPIGPQGEPGPQGDAGPAGADGSKMYRHYIVTGTNDDYGAEVRFAFDDNVSTPYSSIDSLRDNVINKRPMVADLWTEYSGYNAGFVESTPTGIAITQFHGHDISNGVDSVSNGTTKLIICNISDSNKSSFKDTVTEL